MLTRFRFCRYSPQGTIRCFLHQLDLNDVGEQVLSTIAVEGGNGEIEGFGIEPADLEHGVGATCEIGGRQQAVAAGACIDAIAAQPRIRHEAIIAVGIMGDDG